MQMPSIDAVFRGIVAEQTQIKKIGGAGEKFERRKIPFVERAGIGPDPTSAIFFQKADNLGSMPADMAKFNRETKIARQLCEKFPKRWLSVLRRERRRKLDQDDLELWRERLDRAEE